MSRLSNPVLPWVVIFILSALVFPQRGGDNTYARLATLRSMTEAHTFTMDNYKDWSDDWSLSPNGHYYSDKAPGSALLALPAFAIVDLPTLALTSVDDYGADHGRHKAPNRFSYLFLVFTMQLLPFAILILLLANDLLKEGAPLAAVHFFSLAALFGNTAAIYMLPYSGHALAAWLFLAGFFAWRKRKMHWAGFFIAAAVLTDYSTIMTLPFFLLASLRRELKLRPILDVIVGTLPILVLWCWYHTSAFGSPLALGAGYANPENQIYDPANPHSGPRSLVSMMPYPFVFSKLLFGSERGLLFTQAWILFLFPALLWVRKFRLESGLLAGAYLGVFWLNSSVLVWAAGRAAGPRYCCLVFPALAYLAGLIWKELPKSARILLWAGLAEALIFRVVVYGFNERAPQTNLWAYYAGLYREALTGPQASAVLVKVSFISMLFLIAGFFAWRNSKKISEVVA